MGQVLAFPELKLLSKDRNESASPGPKATIRDGVDNVVLFEGVFIEYHQEAAAKTRNKTAPWISDPEPTPHQRHR